jgi:hypothetical protein
MAVNVNQSSSQDAAQAAQHGRHAFEGARLRLWRSARPAQAGKLTSSFEVVHHRPLCGEIANTDEERRL